MALTTINRPDHQMLILGTGEDLKIYHDGSNNKIAATNGNTHIETGATVEINKGTTENIAKFISDQGVELYYNGSKRFETVDGGCNIVGWSNHPDNGKAYFGTGNDFQIWHNGNDSVIRHTSTTSGDDLWIEADTNIFLGKTSGAESMAKFIADGAVELYHNNSKKFETGSHGISVTGYISCSGSSYGYTGGDNVKLSLGNSNDLQIYHDGSHSYINEAGTGQLIIASNGTGIWFQKDVSSSENLAIFRTDGACELNHNNVKKFETNSSGCQVTGTLWADGIDTGDNEKLLLGDGDDLEIYHDGSHSYIKEAGTGNLYISASSKVQIDGANNETMARFNEDGGVELYYNNSKKFETHNSGFTVKGVEDGNATILFHADEGDDNADIWLAQSTTAGEFKIQNLASGAWEKSILADGNGGVELYYDNVKKFETTADGAEIHGRFIVQATGSDTIFNYDDGYNYIAQADDKVTYFRNRTGTNRSRIDASGHYRNEDNIKLVLGTGQDMSIYHDGTNSIIDNDTGDLYIRSTSDIFLSPQDTESGVNIRGNGAVELYYDNTKQLETVNGGVQVTGNLGIGVTPSRELHVKGLDAIVRLESTAATGRNVLEFYDDTGAKGYIGYPSTSNDHFAVGNSDNTDMWFGTNDTERLRITSGGDVLIGGTSVEDQERFLVKSADSPNCYFYTTTTSDIVNLVLRHQRAASGSTGYQVMFKRADATNVGSITSTNTATAYNTSSDYRLKENQVAISDGITRLKQLKPYRFNFKDEPGKPVDGFFAHEVTPTVPEAVTGEKDGTEMQGIDQSKLVPLLTAALQEAITKIETLETKVAALEAG